MAASPAKENTPTGAGRALILPRIPDHALLRSIGRGAYGEVWLARNVLGTYRAVKIVWRERFETTRPFEREFAGIQKFEPISRSHPGLVHILHVGRNEQEGYFFYVMELADDERTGAEIDPNQYQPRTLQREIQTRGRLSIQESLRIGLGLADALAHLHEQSLVHRDIKPSNIIFVKGCPKLADIGLVCGTDAPQSFVGTEGYIPPEGPGSPQADLYSLGKVLYEMATGKSREQFPDLPTDLRGNAERTALLEFNEILLKAGAPDLPAAYLARARLKWTPLQHFPHAKAIDDFRDALTLDPDLDEARHYLGLILIHVGLLEEGMREFTQAIALNPGNNGAHYRIGETYLYAGECQKALDQFETIAPDFNPDLRAAHIGLALIGLGRKEEALERLGNYLGAHPTDAGGLVTSVEAMLYAALQREREAEDAIRRSATKRGFGHFHHTEYHIACAYALMKRNDPAMEWLRKSVAEGFNCYPLFERDSTLAHLKTDPRFLELLASEKKRYESFKSKYGIQTDGAKRAA